MNTFTRNQVALTLAVVAGLVCISAPVLVVVAIWAGDSRWLQTAGAALLFGLVTMGVGHLLFDKEEETT